MYFFFFGITVILARVSFTKSNDSTKSVIDVSDKAIRKIVADENMRLKPESYVILESDRTFYEIEYGNERINDTFGYRNFVDTFGYEYFGIKLDYVVFRYGKTDGYMLKSQADRINADMVCPIWAKGAMNMDIPTEKVTVWKKVDNGVTCVGNSRKKINRYKGGSFKMKFLIFRIDSLIISQKLHVF